MMRRIIVVMMVLMSAFLLCGAAHPDAWYAEETGEKLIINGELFVSENPVLTVHASHYFPLRDMLCLFGIDNQSIVWNGVDRSVTVASDRFGKIILFVNQREYTRNATPRQMATDVIQYNSVVYLPSEFFAEVFDLKVGYDEKNCAVLVRDRERYDAAWLVLKDMFYCNPDAEETIGYHYCLETDLLEPESSVWLRREHRSGTAFFETKSGYCEDNGKLVLNQKESMYRYSRSPNRGFFYRCDENESQKSDAEGLMFRGALLKKLGYYVSQNELLAVDLHTYGMFESMSDLARYAYFMDFEKKDDRVHLFGSMASLYPGYEEYDLFFEFNDEHRLLKESKKTLSKVYFDHDTPPVRQREFSEYSYFSE